MFSFLQDPKNPKITNGIASFSGHLKGSPNIHLGLTKIRRKKFIGLYLFQKNLKMQWFFSIELFQ